MPPMTRIVGISGSLRAASRNTAALRWIERNAPEGVTFELADISDFPLYNRDLEDEEFPAAVERVASQLQAADAVLFATTEYNYSVTGPLKNALDWLSRPPKSLWRKPVAMFGVAGRAGSLRSQLHLREILLHEEVQIVQRPEVLITISDAFEGAEFVGERAQEQVIRLLDALRAMALHRAVGRRCVLVVGRDSTFTNRTVRLLGEVMLDAVVVMTDDEAVSQIESGGFAAVLVGEEVEDQSRVLMKELAMSSPDHLPCIDVPDDGSAARLAIEAIHG